MNALQYIKATVEPTGTGTDNHPTNITIEVFGWQFGSSAWDAMDIDLAKRVLTGIKTLAPRAVFRDPKDENIPAAKVLDPRPYVVKDEGDWDLHVHLGVPEHDGERIAKAIIAVIRRLNAGTPQLSKSSEHDPVLWEVCH